MANIGIDLPLGSSSASIPGILIQILAVLSGAQRTINTVESLAAGNTPAGVQSVSIYFDGSGGTLDGMAVPDGYSEGWSPNKGDDTVSGIPYTPPTGGNLRVVISYVNV